MSYIAREDAVQLLKKYNKDPFHIQHAYTVEAVMVVLGIVIMLFNVLT